MKSVDRRAQRPPRPDPDRCESFIMTLKREEIYANKYDDLEHLRVNIAEFIEEYYNRQRLHSAPGYRPPEEFEQQMEVPGQAESRSATLQFFENHENGKKQTGFSELMTREGDSITVPFRGPQPLL
jgi:Integrase core domain